MEINQKIVLLTGATGGFGRELTRQLLAEGAHLILTDYAAEVLAAFAAEAQAKWVSGAGKVLGQITADLTTPAGCDQLVAEVRQLTPHIDLLINNAGIAFSGSFEAIPAAKWEELMEINLLAPMRLTYQFLPTMIVRQSGHIANVSSSAGIVGTATLTAYSSSKFGLRGFGVALASEMKRHNIGVTNVYPFFTRTPILDSKQFGAEAGRSVPDWLLYEPEFVMRQFINGIKHNKLHVYPGFIPKLLLFLTRYLPWLPLDMERVADQTD